MTELNPNRMTEHMALVPIDQMASSFESFCSRIDTEDIGFVLTVDGMDKYVIFPYHWYQPDKQLIQLEVERELLDQVEELIAPMGISHEQLIHSFLKWCTDPSTKDAAIAYLKNVIETQVEN